MLVSPSVVSDSLWPDGLQHTRLPCPSLSPGVYSNSCPLSRWCHPTVSSLVAPFSSHPHSFPSIRVFSNESALSIRWPKYWSFRFSISPSNKYSGLIAFRIEGFGLLAVKSLLYFLWYSNGHLLHFLPWQANSLPLAPLGSPSTQSLKSNSIPRDRRGCCSLCPASRWFCFPSLSAW